MKRWLEAAARYRKVAEAGLESRWVRPEYPSLKAFSESESFSVALELLAAADGQIVLVNEPERSRRKVRFYRGGKSIAASQQIILDKDGFKLIYVIQGGPCSALYRPLDGEIKPPRPLTVRGVVNLSKRAFYFPEDRILNRLLSELDGLTAWAP